MIHFPTICIALSVYLNNNDNENAGQYYNIICEPHACSSWPNLGLLQWCI